MFVERSRSMTSSFWGEISSGCVVTQTWLAKYSLGRRFSHGTSRRRPLYSVSKRHSRLGIHADPPSTRTTFRRGYFSKTPWAMKLTRWVWIVCGHSTWVSKYVLTLPPPVLGVAPDLGRGRVGQLAADHDRRQKTPVLAEPVLDAPFVHRASELGGEVRVVMAGDVAVVSKGEDHASDI